MDKESTCTTTNLFSEILTEIPTVALWETEFDLQDESYQ